jgi:hypothetical protein
MRVPTEIITVGGSEEARLKNEEGLSCARR